jgi:hypothetical protein
VKSFAQKTFFLNILAIAFEKNKEFVTKNSFEF